VDVEYHTIFSGEEKQIKIMVENNENFDMEEVSLLLDVSEIPFTILSSSERELDNLDEDDEDSTSFVLKSSTEIIPGDYQIPYELNYLNVEEDKKEKKKGSFGIRVSAKTELDFVSEMKGKNTEIAIMGQEGRLTLEIINKGLGEIKSVGVELFPEGFELLSKEKIFVGSIDADDTDTANFDVIYTHKNGVLNAKVTFKDFDNKKQTETIILPFRVYTKEKALELGIINKNKMGQYLGILFLITLIWIIVKKVRKVKRKNNKQILV